MTIKGLELPTAFVDLAQAIQQGGTASFLPIGKFDAYGNFFDVPMALDTAERDLLNWTDETYATYAVPDWSPEELEAANADAVSDPGGIPYITDFSQIVGFGRGRMDYPFCFDFRDNLREPSVIFMDEHYWCRVAPNFKEFMRLYRPSCQSTSLGELWVGISPEDMDLIARTEDALARTVFHGESKRQIAVQAFSGKFGVLDRNEIGTIEAIETLNAYLARLVELGHQDVADAFQSVMKAVVHCEQLSTKQRHSLLSRIERLSGQALLPPDKRVRSNVFNGFWSQLGTGLEEADALAEVWRIWGPKIGAYFGPSSEDQSLIASTEGALAQTASHGEPQQPISDQVTGDTFGGLDRVQMQTHDVIEELNGHARRLIERGLIERGHADFFNAVSYIMSAVALSDELTAQQRIGKRQQLAAVTRQAILPPAERAHADLIEQDCSNLGKGIEEGSALAETWRVWGPKIGAYVGF